VNEARFGLRRSAIASPGPKTYRRVSIKISE